MDINIASIKNYEGKSIPIDCELAIPRREGDDFEALGLVKVNGVIRNFGGTIELEAKGSARLKFICDRCAEEYSRDITFDIAENFKENDRFSDTGGDTQNPDIIYFSGDKLNIDEYVYSSLVISLPGKHLCSDDCKGLCPLCGVNLNHESCSCNTETTDPRFDILDSLDLD